VSAPSRRFASTGTVIALAVIAYAGASVVHEGLGHGAGCLLSGARPIAVSSVHFECSEEGRLVAAGGTLANILVGLLCWWAARRVTRSTRVRYLLWLSMAVNLLQAAGYFLFSGFGNIGDWAVVTRGVSPAWVPRVGLVLLGAVAYYAVVVFSVRELQPFVGPDVETRRRHARELTLVPYLAGGVLSCIAGMLNPVGLVLVGISAAAASFGGTSGLAWMWQLQGRAPEVPLQMAPLVRSPRWIVAGLLVGIAFVAVFGPGLRLG